MTDDTRLNDVHGWGSQSFVSLGLAGYSLNQSSTVADFYAQTKSFEELEQTLKDSGIATKYILPKFRSMWSSAHKRRKREEAAKEAHESGVPVTDTTTAMEQERKTAITDSDQNFLLKPHSTPGAPNTGPDPENVTSNAETPGVDAMDRMSYGNQGIGTGDIAAKVPLTVIPDQTLVISPDDDKVINAPTEVLPHEPVPITPAIAIGQVVYAARQVPPVTLEEKQADEGTAENLHQFKANAEKDIGSDGWGSGVIQDNRIGMNAPATATTPEGDMEEATTAIGKFRSVPLAVTSTPNFDEDQDVSPQDMRTASRHPFRQAKLFRDHDISMKMSALISRTNYDLQKIREAAMHASVVKQGGDWLRWNDATQGVEMVEMPQESSNFLQRGFTTEFQLMGANPLQNTFPESAYASETILGRF